MARLRNLVRQVRALPLRARLALVAAVVLSLVAVLLLAWPAGDDGSDDGGEPGDDSAATGVVPDTSSTTVATGGIEIDAPEGWQEMAVPTLRFGVAVPPGWETVLLSPEGLGALSRADPVVPGFAENAQAAADVAGVLYAAGADEAGRVSDLTVRADPRPEVTDLAGLEAYAAGLAAEAGRAGAQVEVVEGAEHPTVRLSFQAGTGDELAEGTETLVLGPDGFVWSVTVTSDDAAIHAELAELITATLAFAPAE
jgi:hypothetical protein